MEIVILPDAAAVAAAATEFIVDRLLADPTPTLGLAGGSTPRAAYLLLADRDPGWPRITAWLGDERWVPPDDPASNVRMVRESLASKVPVRFLAPEWSGGEPEDAAMAYEAAIDEAVGATPALVLCGMGDDGHTASLFPGTAALEVRDRRYVANWVPDKGVWRLTATFPLLWAARTLVFLVTGDAKAGPLHRIIDEEADLPAGVAARGAGEAVWFVDRAAASGLRGR